VERYIEEHPHHKTTRGTIVSFVAKDLDMNYGEPMRSRIEEEFLKRRAGMNGDWDALEPTQRKHLVDYYSPMILKLQALEARMKELGFLSEQGEAQIPPSAKEKGPLWRHIPPHHIRNTRSTTNVRD
jgi:hypothetical protein